MSFTTEIKNEICQNNFNRIENICMLSGFFRNNAIINKNDIVVLSENVKVIRKIYSVLKEIYDITPVIKQGQVNNFNRKNYYNIIINEKIIEIKQDLEIYNKKNEKINKPGEYFLDSEDLKRAYLRGAFLASGSINDPKKSRYHLEFLVEEENEAEYIKDLLKYFDIKAKVIPRDKGYMTYVKESEKIGDFLRIVSCFNAVLYYEDIRIYRDHKNMTNRLNNCEQANVDKTINASKSQLEDIEIIKEKLSLEALDTKLQEVITYREKYPETSLAELSEIISQETGKNITKSGLNHRIRKIKELAKKLKDE